MSLRHSGRCVAPRWAVLALLPTLSLLASCVTLTAEPRALLLESDRAVSVRSIPCDKAAQAASDADVRPGQTLDPEAIRIVTWNIHKQEDPGWRADLDRFVAASDIVLLQEVVLREPLRESIESAGLRWTMASSFLYFDEDIGVMTAARVAPVAICTSRVVEPLLQLPKSSLVSWYALRGTAERVAVVNVHAINFSLTLPEYREQFERLVAALAAHRGPLVFAGDLNTWTDARWEVVQEAARKLGLSAIGFANDHRTLFLGRQLDHILVRGLEVVDAEVIRVTSSDHNPVRARLRLPERKK